MLQEAAANFLKENNSYMTRKCLLLARLVGLQVQLPVQVVNLNEDGVERLLCSHPQFSEALIIAQAYERDSLSQWAAPVYTQVVLNGNFAYLKAIMQMTLSPMGLISDVLSLYTRRQPPRDDESYGVQLDRVKVRVVCGRGAATGCRLSWPAPLVRVVVISTRNVKHESAHQRTRLRSSPPPSPQKLLECCSDVLARYNLAIQTNMPELRQWAKSLMLQHEYLRDFLSAKARRRAASSLSLSMK